MDYRILVAIKDQFHFDLSDLFGMMMGRLHRDNIGDWFGFVDSLLSKYRAVLTNAEESFSSLGIPVTNDEDKIKNAYRAIALATHPDKTIAFSPEEKLNATEKFIEAKKAYMNIMAHIGKHDELSPTYYLGRISQLF
jgi:DnaJ-domain-containing protein 1